MPDHSLHISSHSPRTDSNRSNLAVQNAGDSLEGDIVLRLTVFSGDPATSPQVLPELTLTPGGFQQISGILVSNGLSLQRGYVRVEDAFRVQRPTMPTAL